MIGRTVRAFAIAGMATAALAGAVPVNAQDAETNTRLRKIEQEVRALQRKVFPGSDGRYFEPEVSAQPEARPVQGAVSTTALTDVLARLDAIETQVQRLTAQYEEGANSLRLMGERVAALEAANAPAPVIAPAVTATVPAATNPALIPAASGSATRPAAAAAEAAKPVPGKPAGPSAARLAAVQAILKPQSDDAGEDEYSYGFRLWDAKFYPEAQQQLSMFLDKYPRHKRVSHARNLLGRAYLDDGKAKEAAPWFLKNYQADKAGERAGDSLLFLAETMIVLKDEKRACIALAEFSENYPALATGRLMSQYEANRKKVKCN